MQANVFAARIPVWRTCVVILVLVGLFACQAAASIAITSLSVANKPDCVTVTVQGNGPLRMMPIQASHYVGFQFAGRLTAKGGFRGIHSGRIYSVRYSRFSENPPTARIVMNTSGTLDYSTEWSSDRTQVTISVWKFGARPATTPDQPAIKVPAVVSEAPASDLPVLPPAEISGPQGSDTGTPDSEPIRLAAAPMRIAAPASSAPARVVAEPVRIAQVVEAPAVQPASAKKVSLNFLGADINDVLKALASQSGENIVASKDVKGEVTVSLSNVTLEEALDYVAKLSGFGYTKSNGTYLVGPKESIKTMDGGVSVASTTEVVPVNYTNCDDLLVLLKAQCPDVQASKVSARQINKTDKNAPTDSKIVLAGPEEAIAAARLLIGQVDDAVKGQKAESKTSVYRVKYVNVSEMAKSLRTMIPGITVGYAPSQGFDLSAPAAIKIDSKTGAQVQQAAQGGSGDSSGGGAAAMSGAAAGGPGDASGTNSTADTGPTKSQSLIISGPTGDVEAAMSLAEILDTKTPQIKFEAKITTITEAGEKKLGLSWNWGDLSILEDSAGPLIEKNDKYTSPVAASPNVSVNQSLNRYWRQPLKFGATLDALVTNGDGKILASPNLLCLENKPGVFFVGDEVRYITLIDHTQNGTTVTTETANVGVQLRVVAQVNPDGYITMNLHPEVSVLKLTHDPNANMDLPIITRRFTDHTVRVKQGQTIVIGGLINQNDLDTISKVPILGDLPVLGNLFRHRDKVKDHSEVVIFITATLVGD